MGTEKRVSGLKAILRAMDHAGQDGFQPSIINTASFLCQMKMYMNDVILSFQRLFYIISKSGNTQKEYPI